MKRKIITIDEKLCNGCGLCVNACHEGAIQLVEGKARLVSDKYCDGLGDCLPACPTGAIEITEREAEAYDEAAVERRIEKKVKENKPLFSGCPGTMARRIERMDQPVKKEVQAVLGDDGKRPSELRQWPVQLNLVNPRADYLENADLLIAADCTAFAYGDFHKDFIKDRVVVMGCPKLDDNDYYTEKLTEIFANNDINSIMVVKMEVPCCNGIVSAVKQAMLAAKTILPYQEITIGVDGTIK